MELFLNQKNKPMSCPDGFLKGCAGKVKHKSYLGAEYARNENINSKNASIYKCDHCFQFHIGTTKSKKQRLKLKPKGDGEQHKRKHKRFKY